VGMLGRYSGSGDTSAQADYLPSFYTDGGLGGGGETDKTTF